MKKLLKMVLYGGFLGHLTISLMASEAQESTLRFIGTVHFINVEGGFFGITDTLGNQYLPLNLDESFQQDGLRVRVRGELAEGMMSFQNRGRPLRIQQITPTSCLDFPARK